MRSQLFDLGAVREEKVGDDGQWLLRLELSRQDAEKLGRLPGAEGMLVRDTILGPHCAGAELAARQGET